MTSLSSRLAALKARKAAVESPPPSTDAAELVASFRAAPATAPVWSPEQRLKGAWIAVIDTETTGVDPAVDRIVEIAVVVVDGLGLPDVEPVVALSIRLNPGIPIPEGATKVHGISDADVAGCPTFAEVWPQVLAAVGDRIPAAFNAPFDFRMIGGECKRAGLGTGPGLAWGRWLDPMVLGRGLDKFEKGKKLTDIARRRGIALSAHGGAGDAVATAMLTLELIREATIGKRGFQAPAFPTLGTWLPWQREQALAQEADLVAYLRKSGRVDPVDCPWHELEGVPLPDGAAVGGAPPAVQTTSCAYCHAPIVWVVGQNGAKHPCDPAVVTATPQADVLARRVEDLHARPPGIRVGLVLADGSVQHGYLDPAGTLTGRVSHWITCPAASRVKADQAAKRGAA